MSEDTMPYDAPLTIRRVRPVLDDIHWSMYGEWPPLGHDYAEQLPYLKFFLETPDELPVVAVVSECGDGLMACACTEITRCPVATAQRDAYAQALSIPERAALVRQHTLHLQAAGLLRALPPGTVVHPIWED